MESSNPWKTNVAAEYFNVDEKKAFNHKSLYIAKEQDKFVYKLEHENKFYILKGSRLILPEKSLDYNTYYEELDKIFFNLYGIYTEYYLAKFASILSFHFCKVLNCDFKLENPPEGSGERPAYIVETLQEFGGTPLNQVVTDAKKSRIKTIYNFMYQSARALEVLHKFSAAHLDIKPDNIVYEELNDLIKIIDLGTSTSVTRPTKLHTGVKVFNFNKTIRGATEAYAAPEILREYSGISLDNKIALSGVDVYCWAVTFYALLTRKTELKLIKETQEIRIKDENDYPKWIDIVKKDLSILKIAEEEKEIFTIIQKILLDSLAYQPEKRPKFEEIITTMKALVHMLPEYEKKAIEERRNLIIKIAGKNAAMEAVPRSPQEFQVLQDERNKLEMLVKNLEEKNQKAVVEIKENNTQKNELIESLRLLRKELEEKNKEINQIKTERDDRVKDISKCQDEKKELENKEKCLREEIKRLEGSCEKIKEEKEKLITEKNELQENLKQENIKCEDLIKQNTNQLKIEGEPKKEISDRESQRQIMNNEIIELKKLVEERKKIFATHTKTIAEYQNEIYKLRDRLDELSAAFDKEKKKSFELEGFKKNFEDIEKDPIMMRKSIYNELCKKSKTKTKLLFVGDKSDLIERKSELISQKTYQLANENISKENLTAIAAGLVFNDHMEKLKIMG